MENNTSISSFKKFIKSFVYAFNGIKNAALTQRNFRVHILIAIFVIVIGILFKICSIEWIIILTIMAIVVSAELFNTAIEGIVDIVSPEYNEKAGKIKDYAAAAVLITAIAAAIVGLIIFVPKLILLFKH